MMVGRHKRRVNCCLYHVSPWGTSPGKSSISPGTSPGKSSPTGSPSGPRHKDIQSRGSALWCKLAAPHRFPQERCADVSQQGICPSALYPCLSCNEAHGACVCVGGGDDDNDSLLVCKAWCVWCVHIIVSASVHVFTCIRGARCAWVHALISV